MQAVLKPIKAVEVQGDWYVVPLDEFEDFLFDSKDDELLESGDFDNIWGKYQTGGDLNLIQLWAEM